MERTSEGMLEGGEGVLLVVTVGLAVQPIHDIGYCDWVVSNSAVWGLA
jgi:hypothetical protein